MADNAFSAIKISLASPEQIRSWSYGEVTKPETINYRNQKPEKDGLFDERIFGPTKDFECYCGKYKRIRYRGVICDRCGVEVTRAKVRRERMGHINLAAPVAHIWFAKGTPSWLGLLLDMSPRNLERVLYYAQHIITSVDEEAKQEVLDSFQRNEDEITSVIQSETEAAIASVREEMGKGLAEIERKRANIRKQVGAKVSGQQAPLREQADSIKAQLATLARKKATEEITLDGQVIVEIGATVVKAHTAALETTLHGLLEAIVAEFGGETALVMGPLEEEENKITGAAAEEVTLIQSASSERLKEARRTWDDKRGEVEELAPLRPLTDIRYRDLHDSYPDLFSVSMGAEALLDVLAGLDLDALREELRQEASTATGQRAKKAAKRLRVVEGFRKSDNKPEWMVLTILPVLPPDLRPMVQLDGGRFATSDLNDLYRRVINRNNRLKRLMGLGAPEIIVRNEKRMLQEAVDALIDNGRRGRALTGSHNHKLKSLSDMLRGKQGRFRQNLLGKRVDYSGRSVIVVGATLKLHQCGLPKRMALELFKPFVMHRLVLQGLTPNIKSAKRMVDRVRPEVWDILEEVIKERPVFLNRAPTLHRLGIQAFEPVLVEGSAIQIHPLVCTAYNADFDGDQMAVHIPIGRRAVVEARKLMLSIHNMLLPSSGEPVVAPTLDIVVGCYYLTTAIEDVRGEGNGFITYDDAKLSYDLGQIDLRAEVRIRNGIAVGPDGDQNVNLLPRLMTNEVGETVTIPPRVEQPLPEGWVIEPIVTTVGRILFNEVVPSGVAYRNQLVDKRILKEVVVECYQSEDHETTALVLDALKKLGFHFATESGLTIALNDIVVPPEKAELVAEADAAVGIVQGNYQRGLLSEEEQEERVIDIWQGVNRRMEEVIKNRLHEFGNLYLMAGSGAKGNIAQIKQMAGMRGLMADPKGKILPLPIRSSFREGLTVLEYFISTHGARKGLADTALRTADAGYLTRRLIDVAQDMIAFELDCGVTEGIWMESSPDRTLLGSLSEHIVSRVAAAPVAHPKTGEIIVDRNEEIDEKKAAAIQAAEITRVYVRSPLKCEAPRGICFRCYGRSLARGRLVERGEAVGIIAAQSIGEPGTQLTMRTFHTGGVAGVDITSGLPRVEELFEARVPKQVSPLAENDGVAEIIDDGEGRHVRIISEETITEEYALPRGFEFLVEAGAHVDADAEIARPVAKKTATKKDTPAPASLRAVLDGQVSIKGRKLTVVHHETEERTYRIPPNARILVESGARVSAGTPLTEGSLNPQDVLRIRGQESVQRYLVAEVQKVYRAQGVTIHDKHIEIIVRQMLRRVRVEQSGDTPFLQGELIDSFLWQSINAKTLAEGGEPSTAQGVLLGITKVSLSTESFLAAASFQETTRVLTEAALFGKVDRLLGLKENVIIGRLIPARLDSTPEELLLERGGVGVATALAGPDEGAPSEDGEGVALGDDEDDGVDALLKAALAADSNGDEGGDVSAAPSDKVGDDAIDVKLSGDADTEPGTEEG